MFADRPCTASTSGASGSPNRCARKRPDARSRSRSNSSAIEVRLTAASCEPGDLNDDVEVGRAFPRVNALKRRDVRVVPAHTDTHVLLVDVGVVGGVVVPPAARPCLDPGVALAVDGVTDGGLAVGMQITRHIT